MADYRLTITPPGGTGTDITQRMSTLTWSGSIRRVSRQIEAELVTPNDKNLPELPCALGSELRLTIGGEGVFLGHIVTRDKATDGVTTSITALDRGRFLANNEGWYQFSAVTPERAVAALCADFSVPVGQLASGAAVSRKFPGVALSKIVDTLYTLSGEQNGRRYLARFTGAGALEVVEKPTAATLEIAPEKNLQTLRITEDISSLQNAVAIYSDAGQLIRTVRDEESVAQFGQFQHVLTQRDGEDAGAEARAWLEDHGLQQTMTVECLGYAGLISGNAVVLRANRTGAAGLCWIDSDTHTFKNGQYFCRLELNFRNLMNETTAGSDVT